MGRALGRAAALTNQTVCRYLFRLIDLDNSDSLQDEEIIPLLKAAGLDEATAKTASLRLLGDQLTVRAASVVLARSLHALSFALPPKQMNSHQFAAAMLEEEITGEPFPLVLLQMAKAFSNIDVDDRLCACRALRGFAWHAMRAPLTPVSLPRCRARSEIDATKLLVVFRKLGVKFSLADRDLLFKQMDTAHRGAASFTEFAVSFSRVDCSKLGGLAEVFRCVVVRCLGLLARGANIAPALRRRSVKTLASVTSYELTSSVEELDSIRDVAGRPVLERTAAALLERKGKRVAETLELKEREQQRRADGILDNRVALGVGALSPMAVLRVTLCCWWCILRCTSYGIGSGGFSVLFEQASNKYFPITENEPTGAFAHYVVWVHYIIAYLPSIIVSFIEAMVIYYDLLRTALAVAEIAGLKLWPLDPVRLFVTNSIVAEALELGHPTYVRYGIDPMRGSSRLVLYLCGLLYSARGGLSKFVIKVHASCRRCRRARIAADCARPALRRLLCAGWSAGRP